MNRVTKPTKVCVITGTRADYGLLNLLMQKINNHKKLELQLIVCGSHLSKQYGMTINQIKDDGFKIDAQVVMLNENNSSSSTDIIESMAKGLVGFNKAFTKLQPDCILILGDRYEILAAAQTALLMGIQIVHIHGGEITQGAVDDSIRHAITKMASLHFCATKPYRERIIQMGESPDSVFHVGAPGLELIQSMPKLTRKQLETNLEIKLFSPLFLVTYHPVTNDNLSGLDGLESLFKAFDNMKNDNITVVWTGSNADESGKIINQKIQQWVQETQINAVFKISLGSKVYISMMEIADVVVGNSSSGIIEAPALGTPSLNIGNRQQGRLQAKSIMNCREYPQSIVQSLRSLQSDEMLNIAKQKLSPYSKSRTSDLICEHLTAFSFSSFNEKSTKIFYDIPLPRE